MPQGETVTLYFGAWTLRTGTGRLDKGCYATGNLFDEETGMAVRRFTQAEEDDQRAQ